MMLRNVLDITARGEFRRWLEANAGDAPECWVAAKRSKTAPDGALWYLDAVEEALCFGWIDSTVKTVDGVALQRFCPRRKNSQWSELNKERCRRLEHLGLMTDAGRRVLPDLNAPFCIIPEVAIPFAANERAWENFNSFPDLYRRVRIDTVQIKKSNPALFQSRLAKLIAASEKGEMIGAWHDNGRLLDYRSQGV